MAPRRFGPRFATGFHHCLLGNLFLIELDPYGIGTFDFPEARRALSPNSSKYDNARMKAAHRIEELYSAQGRRRVSQNRWESSDLTTMHQLFKVYKSQQIDRTFKYISRRLVIEANSLLQEGEEGHGTRDLVVQMLKFAPSQEPIDCIAAQIFTDPGERPSDVTCDVYDAEGNPVPFQPIPVRDADNSSMYGLLIYFTPPLEPSAGGTYFLRTEFRVGQAFPGLRKGEGDEMESRILRADGVVAKLELVAQVPKSFGKILGSSSPPPFFKAQPMNPRELWELSGSAQFQAYGWIAENVPNGDTVNIALRKA